MTTKWEKIYVFISSTFNDMHAERDYLVKQVFPQLQEWCEKRKLRLVDIDLRWGVTEADATQNKRVVQVCLERIDTCRPFFLCFLGQRRGWVPGQEDISAETYADYPELAKYAGEASVTEMEILHALVNPLHQGRPHPSGENAERYERAKYAFFYLRQPEYLKDLPADLPQLRQVYTNEAILNPSERDNADEELQRWREVEIPRTGRPVRSYHARWEPEESTPEILMPVQAPTSAERGSPTWQTVYAIWSRQWANVGVQVDELGEISNPIEMEKAKQYNNRLIQGRLGDFTCETKTLAEAVIEDLKIAIQDRYPDHVESANLTPLQRELDLQEQFLQAVSEGFIEREGDFTTLDQYVKDNSQQLFVLAAPGGMGKTSLLARWIDRLQVNSDGGESLHYRFIGASDGSTTVDGLLRSLLRELQEIGGKVSEEISSDPNKIKATIPWKEVDPVLRAALREREEIFGEFTGEIPTEPNKLRMDFPKLLESAGKKRKTIIVLDGLNQLESKLSDLAWLPLQLPANVKMVVSFKRGESQAESYYDQLQVSGKVILAEVTPFNHKIDRKKLVQVYLSQFLKELDQRYVETLIKSKGARNPLYLKVVLSELRVFGEFANLEKKILADFGTNPVSAFQGLLKRLETDTAYSAVQPELLVPRVFGWLAEARQGLSVEELTGLLVQEGMLPDDVDGRQKASEAVYGLLRQMRSYLARREGRVDFFYESFKLAATVRYVQAEGVEAAHPQGRLANEWHAALAGYFARQPDANRRRLIELPYQQTNATLWTELAHTLTDFDFLEAKCAAFSVFDLEEDFLLGLEKWKGDPDEKKILAFFEERLRLDTHILQQAPELLFTQLYNHLVWLDAPDGPIHKLCTQASQNRTGWLRSIQDIRTPVNAKPVSPQPNPQIQSEPHGPLLGDNEEGKKEFAVTPDGRYIVCELKIWDLASGKPIRTLEGQFMQVTSVTVTSDGQLVVAGLYENTVKVWDLTSGRLIRTLMGPQGSGFGSFINQVVVTHDCKYVVSASSDKTLNLWDLASGQHLRTLRGHLAEVEGLAVTKDGQKVVSGSRDGTLNVWELPSGRLLQSLKDSRWYLIDRVAVTPDGRYALAGAEGAVKVWDLNSGQLVRSIVNSRVRLGKMVAVTPDGQVVIGAGRDNAIRLFNLNTGQLLRTMKEGDWKLSVISLALTADGKQVISGSLDGSIKVWDLTSGEFLRSFSKHSLGVGETPIKPDVQPASSAPIQYANEPVRLIDGKSPRSSEVHSWSGFSLLVTPDGQQVISAEAENTIKVWETCSGRLLFSLEGQSPLALTPNGRLLISGSENGTIKVWDLVSKQLVHVLTPPLVKRISRGFNFIGTGIGKPIPIPTQVEESVRPNVQALTVTPDGSRLIANLTDKLMQVWDLGSGRLLMTLEHHSDVALSAAVTANTRCLVSCAHHTIEMWDLSTGKFLRSCTGHTGTVWRVVLAQNGQSVLSSSDDGTIKAWAMSDGHLLWSCEAHESDPRMIGLPVADLVVTPDGRKAISAGYDRTVKVWDVLDGTLLHTLKGHSAKVEGLVVTPDGQKVISWSADKTVRLWDLSSGSGKHLFIDEYGVRVSLSQDGHWIILSGYGSFWIFEWVGVVPFASSKKV